MIESGSRAKEKQTHCDQQELDQRDGQNCAQGIQTAARRQYEPDGPDIDDEPEEDETSTEVKCYSLTIHGAGRPLLGLEEATARAQTSESRCLWLSTSHRREALKPASRISSG